MSLYFIICVIIFKMEGVGWETGWGVGVAPSVSIKDRSVVGCADRGLNCTNRMLGVGGSRNR